MKEFIEEIEQYISDVLGATATLLKWQDAKRTPAYIKTRYEFWTADLLELNCLFMIDSQLEEETL